MSSWTKKEDDELNQKVDDLGTKWTKISTFFPGKSPSCLKMHYHKLQKSKITSADNDLTIKESYEENNLAIEENPEEKMENIRDILKKKINNKEKIRQIAKFENIQVFQEIIRFSLDFPTSCPFLSYFLDDLFDHPNYPKQTFLEVISHAECKILLQFCRSFSVLNDYELENIDYIKSDDFFFQGPIFAKISRNEILEKARQEKKEKSPKNSPNPKEENEICSTTIYELKKQIFDLKQKLELLDKKENLATPINSNVNYLVINDEKFVQLSEKFPMMINMINKFLNKQSNDDFYKFCSLIHILNNKAYNKLYDFLPLLSISSCYGFISPIRKTIKDLILNYQCIPNLLHKFYQGIIDFDENHKAKEPIYVTLGGDAAALKNFTDKSTSAVYVFDMLPLKKQYPSCVIHLMKTRNGSSPKHVVDMYPLIIKCLNDFNFKVKFQATDGDVSFDRFHKSFFKKNIEPILNKPFIEIVDSLNLIDCLLVSDPFHLLKCGRSKLIQHLVLIDPDSLRCVNTALFSEAVQLGPVFNDRSQSGAMKDNYALSLFSWYSFLKVMEKGRFDAAYYILPYLFFIEAFRSPLLSNESRLKFLGYSFNLFKEHLLKIYKVNSESMFKQRYSSKSLGVLFGEEIFLMRILNTIAALGVAVKYFPDSLATQRVGTHCIELFFGSMRLLSFYNDDFSNAIRVVSEAIIIRQFSEDIKAPIKINKRDNEAGITLTKEINSLENLEFDGYLLTEVIYNLMNGKLIKDEDMNAVELMINNYTEKILKCVAYKCVKKPKVICGTLPMHRNNVINYSLSVIPVPKYESAFDYYLKDKKFRKKVEKLSINEWCMKLCASLYGIDFHNQKNKFKIPFKYNLDNPN